MWRFVDLGKQLSLNESDPLEPRQFAFYNTVSDQFLVVNGMSAFEDWDDFESEALADEMPLGQIHRARSLCPTWVFESKEKPDASSTVVQ